MFIEPARDTVYRTLNKIHSENKYSLFHYDLHQKKMIGRDKLRKILIHKENQIRTSLQTTNMLLHLIIHHY